MTALLVAATKAEAAHLPDLPLVICGIGKTAAASAVARALAETPGITRVVNVGTAGALRAGMSGLFLPGRVFNHEISADALRVLGYDPFEWLEADGDPDIALASGDVFVTDPAVRDRLASVAHLVDMEGYAVAWACRTYDVPLTLVKHVSDSADESAMEWLDVVDASARVLGDWVRANVD